MAAAACELFSDLALFSLANERREAGTASAASASIVDDAATALETFLVVSVQTSSEIASPSKDVSSSTPASFPWLSAKHGMRCVIELCRSAPNTAVTFISTISSLLKIADEEMTILLLETLAAIGSYNVGALRMITDDLAAMLNKNNKRMKATAATSSSHDDRRLELLCTLLFQAATTRASATRTDTSATRSALDSIVSIFASRPAGFGAGNWSAYRISRQAARYGHHDVAIGILRRLSACGVASTFFSAWLKGFHHLCRVEDILRQMTDKMAAAGSFDAMDNEGTTDSAASGDDSDEKSASPLRSLLAATEAAHLSVTQLTAAASATHPLTFPLQLARLRAASLQSCIQLIRASICLRTCPPPAIAASGGAGGGSEATKGSRVSLQLHGVSKEFRSLADQINSLLQASFDADALSLKYLNLLRLSASILISAIDSLIIYAPSAGGQKASSRGLASTQVLNSMIGGADSFSLLDVKNTPLDLRRLVENCKAAIGKLSAIVEHPTRPLPSVDKRVQLIQVTYFFLFDVQLWGSLL